MTLNEILEQLQKLTEQVEDMMNENVFEEDGLVERIHNLGSGIYTLNAGGGYNAGVDVLCEIRNTGNGFIACFPSYSSSMQDNYICMGYDEADALRKLLTFIHKEEQ